MTGSKCVILEGLSLEKFKGELILMQVHNANANANANLILVYVTFTRLLVARSNFPLNFIQKELNVIEWNQTKSMNEKWNNQGNET